MNVPTITMPRDEAKERLREYRTALHRKADAEWQAAANGYEQMAKGRALIVLSDVFRTAPVDGKKRPKLAIARADQREVCVMVSGWPGRRIQFSTSWGWGRRGRAPHNSVVTVPSVEAPAEMHSGYAFVPMVPPDVGRHDLSLRFILWEVEQWADRPQTQQPDRDPYLLLRVSADLFAVVGSWDLTPLERAVMGGRLAQ